eukprot:TRINITY_DN16966_c0_g1_i1.p1 TRINITY_DN16966_c0_g1~~TRINITY_DN16966_c0_g1_i1.p1  ORF type:complete len:982 (+),score=332.14 TRINITY_DN16966_c0_g1_i1:1235-4180(+)
MMELSAAARNVTVDIVTTVGVDERRLGLLRVADFLAPAGGRRALGCLLQPLVLSSAGRAQGCCQWCGLSVPGLAVRIGSLDMWEFSVGTPGWGAGPDQVLRGAAAALLGPYEPALLRAAPVAAGRLLRPLLNLTLTALVGAETEAAGGCYEAPTPAGAGAFLNFSSSAAVAAADFVLDRVLQPSIPRGGGADSNDASINAALRAFAAPDGALAVRGGSPLLSGALRHGSGEVRLRVWNASIAGLEQVAHLALLRPNHSDPYGLVNAIAMLPGAVVSASAEVAVEVAGFADAAPISNRFRLVLWAEQPAAEAAVHAQVVADRLYALQLRHLASPPCLLAALGGQQPLRLPRVQIGARTFGVELRCVQCSSPMLQGAVQSALASPEGIQVATHAINGLLAFMGGAVNSRGARAAVDRAVSAAQCPAPPPPSGGGGGSSDPGSVVVYSVILGINGLALLCMGARLARAARRAGGVGELRWGEALWASPAVPRPARALVPVGLAACFGLFVSAHLSWAIEACVVFHVAGDKVPVTDMFHYQLKTAVGDMWNAGVYPLSLLICVMSGAWPYVKLFLLAFLWFMPPDVVAPSPRGTCLQVVDYLGKWSLVDMFVFVMFVVAFRTRLASPPKLALLPPDAVQLDLFITPHWGLHGFVVAAMLSLAVNHYQVFLHKRAAGAAPPEEKPLLGDRESGHISKPPPSPVSAASSPSWAAPAAGGAREVLLLRHVGGEGGGPGVRLKAVCTALLLVSFGGMLWGAVTKTFSFEMGGLVSVALNYSSPGSTKREFSVLTLTSHMVSQAGDVSAYMPSLYGSKAATYLAYWFIGVVFITFTLVVPIVQVVSLLTMWLAPLTLPEQRRLLFGNKVLAAWSATEVFVVSLFAAVLEIGQFAQFLIGGKCDWINSALAGPGEALEVPQALGGIAPKCFEIRTELRNGVWILFAAIAMVNLAYAVLLRAVSEAIARREMHNSDAAPADSDDAPDPACRP